MRRSGALQMVAAGLCLGGAHLHPSAAPLAWLGAALFSFSLTAAPTRQARLLVAVGVCWLNLFVAQIWLCLCIANYMGPLIGRDSAPLWLSTVTWALATSIETSRRALPVALGALLLGGRLPTRWWLPTTLLAGEALGGSLGFMMGDLIHSQWRLTPVLRSVALVGPTATAWLGCFAAAAIGEGAARGQLRPGVALSLPVAVWFSLMPATPPADDALIGVAAVHMRDAAHPPSPQALASDVALLIWPEAALRVTVPAGEGPAPAGLKVTPLSAWTGVDHVVNVTSETPEGAMNAIALTGPDVSIRALRGKAALTPWGERAWGGLDPLRSPYLTGRAPSTLDEDGWRLVATLCYEVYAEGLFEAGVARGGELLVNIANDRAYGPSVLGIEQAIGVLALRAAQTHRPAARASLWGRAAMISSTGEVLATSEADTTGLLRWDGRPGRPTYTTAVLSDGQMPTPFACAAPACIDLPLNALRCDAHTPVAQAVVISGHSLPPLYLSETPTRLARAIACLKPALVVLDTCYGFSTPLLAALVREGVQAQVVGSRRQVPGPGLSYAPAFFTAADARSRAAAIRWGTDALESWPIDGAQLDAALAQVAAWTPEELTRQLQRVHPNLVNVPLGDSGATALVPVPPERFRAPPPAGAPAAPAASTPPHPPLPKPAPAVGAIELLRPGH